MVKKVVKKLLGQSNWDRFVASVKYAKTQTYFKRNHVPTFKLSEGWEKEDFFIEGKHTFFGYYDISQLNPAEDKILAHVVDHKAVTSRDCAGIGYFSVTDKKYVQITTTKAWCWQQGARLRWHPLDSGSIIVNDVEGDHYVSKVLRIDTKETVRVIPMALYDIDSCFTYGLSLNFSRLQRLRPGYGYDSLPDLTENDKAPVDDGIFYYDLATNQSRLIISLKDMATKIDSELKYQHYFNHISIAPDGKRFLFFHIWNGPEIDSWKTRLCVYDFASGKTTVLEDIDKVSHYDWKSNEELLVTCLTSNKSQYYALYHAVTGKKECLENDGLKKDGHPSFYKDATRFISDTYPLTHNMQTLFEYDMQNDVRTDIVAAYSSPLLYGEYRCDMHPRLSASQKYISFDSTFSHNRRQIVFLKKCVE